MSVTAQDCVLSRLCTLRTLLQEHYSLYYISYATFVLVFDANCLKPPILRMTAHTRTVIKITARI
jgi:hypothetical protein